MSFRFTLLCLIAFGFGLARFLVPVEGKIDHADVFKDFAHLFVGGLFGAAILATALTRKIDRISTLMGPLGDVDIWIAKIRHCIASTGRSLWILAIGLTVLEIVAFIVRQQ